jgi:hypothetical protein
MVKKSLLCFPPLISGGRPVVCSEERLPYPARAQGDASVSPRVLARSQPCPCEITALSSMDEG